MGWVNYIKIPKLKLLVEVSREISEELPDYDRQDIEKILSFGEQEFERCSEKLQDDVFSDSILEMKIGDIVASDFCVAIKAFRLLISVPDIEGFFMYWLEDRDLDYEVISEYDDFIQDKQYRKERYRILKR